MQRLRVGSTCDDARGPRIIHNTYWWRAAPIVRDAVRRIQEVDGCSAMPPQLSEAEAALICAQMPPHGVNVCRRAGGLPPLGPEALRELTNATFPNAPLVQVPLRTQHRCSARLRELCAAHNETCCASDEN